MTILFISEILPLDTYASEVVFYRHLTKLANDGHQIHIVTDQNSFNNRKKEVPANFHIHLIPNRRWYYPPFKSEGILQKFRFLLYYQAFIKNIIATHKVDRLLGFIHGNFLLAFTAYVQEKTRLPLVSFFHDDTAELNFNKNTISIKRNTERILKASKHVMVASEAFFDSWKAYSSKFKILYPIAEQVKSMDEAKRSNDLTVGYSGSVYNEIISVLDKLSSILNQAPAKFIIIGNNENANYLQEKYENVTCLPLFERADQANKFIMNTCKFSVIAYPEDVLTMPWIKTCFPSKFIQNCNIGIPTIVIAPKESAIGKWCIKNNWPLYLQHYQESEVINLLNRGDLYKLSRSAILKLCGGVFNPAITHQTFVDYLINSR